MKTLGKRLTLDGISGKQYLFDLFSFDDFSELKDAFQSRPAIYVFTRRRLVENGYTHDLVYLGETKDLSTRFEYHHKEQCISAHHANCIGIHGTSIDENERKSVEKDILSTYDFPCNEQLN